MTVKESHFRCCKKDFSIIAIADYDPVHGYNGYIGFIEVRKPVPTREEVIQARTLAFDIQAKKPDHDVVITYMDSEVIADNARNAPIQGNSRSIGVDNRGFDIYPKMVCPEPPAGLYNWLPMTREEINRGLEQAKKRLYDKEKQERENKRKKK